MTKIEWTNETWNPVTGCTKISPGCANCYAERFAERWRGIAGHPFEQGFDLRLWSDRLSIPAAWKKPRLIFVNSMSDLFHEDVPDAFIKNVFVVMNEIQRHQFQILTKRPERMIRLSGELQWTPNIWAGVSVESQAWTWRAEALKEIPAKIRFLSCEPLLGSLDLRLDSLHWVIAGGESGPRSRRVQVDWVRHVRDSCVSAGVPFFFKQWGGTLKKKSGRNLDGRSWDQMPEY